MPLAARRTLRHPTLVGLTLLLGAFVTVPAQADDTLHLGPSLHQQTAALPAVPCTPQAAGSEWFSASAAATPASLTEPEPALATTPPIAEQETAGQHFAASLRPSFPLGDDEGVTTAATLAGATLMLLGGWRWYRSSRLPWPPEGAFDQERIAYAPGSVPAWNLSGFDDLPDVEPERAPLRPLYDSLDDDDVIDVEPLPARS